MSADRHEAVETILREINHGRLPPEETERRLTAMLEDSLAGSPGQPKDALRAELCSSLLWQLRTHGAVSAPKPEPGWMEAAAMRRNGAGRIRRIAVAAALALLILGWFGYGRRHTEPAGGADSIRAASHRSPEGGQGMTTDTLEEMEAVWGGTAGFPETIDGRFVPIRCIAVSSDLMEGVSCCYECSGTREWLTLRSVMVYDPENDVLSWDQGETGECRVISGKEVRACQNGDECLFSWNRNGLIWNLQMKGDMIDSWGIVQEIISMSS